MLDIYAKIFDLLDGRERRNFLILMGVMIAVAFAEVIGVSAVFVLLGVLAQPEEISSNETLFGMLEGFGASDTFSVQVTLAIIVFVVVMLGIATKALGIYALIRFVTMRSYSISSKLLKAYLYQPYLWFLTRNSSDTSHRILGEVDRTVGNLILPSLRLVANAILSLAVIGLLVVIDPVISILSASLLGGGYGMIYLWLRSRLRQAGQELQARSAERFRLVNEVSGGFREVKLLGLEPSYAARYDNASRRRSKADAKVQIMGEMPRFLLEALTFGVLLVLVFVLLLRNDGDFLTALPTLGVFAYAVMRLLPALQQIYHGLASMRAHASALDLVHGDLQQARASHWAGNAMHAPDTGRVLNLTSQLELEDVGFLYPNSSRTTLDGVTLTVPARQTIGFVGGTGAGKTTLIDLILGLLTPETGEIRVDGEPITQENLRAWQRNVGYVPQTIYLTDDTVAANIAFGIPPEDIDMAAVERAGRLAALHDFVERELQDGYNSVIGERGVRLSGGQRQRIGIARALYHNPSVLILDEATSALDNITERVVMEAIASLRDDKTILLIAHRLTTVRECDTIFMMEQGRIVAEGSYDDLVKSNPRFREMAMGRSA